ncbi:MAG: hypothetical protein ABI442_21115 [Gemmatimonadaceae bacterium]
MGYETTCRARVTDERGVRDAESKVLLETDELIVRGEARVKIPRASIQKVSTRAGVVTITSPTATVSLNLGADAAVVWKKKLEEPPKRLIDKLDVKSGASIWVIGDIDETLIAQLGERSANVCKGRTAKGVDAAFVSIETPEQLERIDRALAAITDAGSVWAIHRKGPTGVADTTIFAHATSLGLTYVKVARVSESHTAEKLVRPMAARAKGK